MNKTLLQWQDEISAKYGYRHFQHLLRMFDQSRATYTEIKNIIDEAAEAYARERCEAQKSICAEMAVDKVLGINYQNKAFSTLIKEAPNACDKTK